ncbi:hypothetical protein PQQ86_00600 [Paraburkholderia sediminicola]|jgi:hypothetical protein
MYQTSGLEQADEEADEKPDETALHRPTELMTDAPPEGVVP